MLVVLRAYNQNSQDKVWKHREYWNPKLFPSLLYLANAASVWPHRFSHPPLLTILYFESAEIIMFLLAKKGFSCHFLTTAIWNEPRNLVQGTVALMDPSFSNPTVSCWHVTQGTTAFLPDTFMLLDNLSDELKHRRGVWSLIKKTDFFWVRDSGRETSLFILLCALK